MTTRISLGLALLAATLVMASVVDPRPGPTIRRPSAEPSISKEESPIAHLDRCIQKRLHEKPGFGASRLVDSPTHLFHFEPESSEESEALADLRGSGWTVGLLLRGQDMLGPDRTEGVDERSVYQPIAVTSRKLPGDLPLARELRPIGRRALAASGTADSASGQIGRWSVEARVVRADRKSCVDCHTRFGDPRSPSVDGIIKGPLKIGDALGVVIYVYTRDRRSDDPGPSTPNRREFPR